MKPEDVRKLLGGYATGTLTDTERDLLFAAALQDQALFDALADEESLRMLLSDPEARGHLLTVLDEKDISENEDRRKVQPSAVSAHPAFMQATPMPASPVRAGAAPAVEKGKSWLSSVTPRRMAFAGAVAAMILIIGTIVTVERSRSAAPVELAENRPSQAAPARDEAPAIPSEQAPAKQRNRGTQNASAEGALEKRSSEAAPLADRGDAAPSPQAPVQIAAASSATETKAGEQAKPLTAAKPNATQADEQPRASDPPANAVKDVSKESERKVEQKNEPATVTAQANAVQPPRVEPAPPAAAVPPLPSGAKRADDSELTPKRQALQPQGLAAGIMNKSRFAESSRLTAAITDINGTIVSVNAGTEAGLMNGETLEIVRNGTVLGTIRLTDTRAMFAVGSLTRSPGAEPPRAGDSLRRQTTPATR